MKLLAPLEAWQYISIAAAVAAACIVIICIIIWAVKKNRKNGSDTPPRAVKEERSMGSRESEGAYAAEYEDGAPAQKPVKQAQSKPAQKPEPKPVEKTEPDMGKVYHISKRKDDGKWQIKAEGGAKAIKLFSTQAEAIEYGKQLALNQDARIILHKLDGSFRKLTY